MIEELARSGYNRRFLCRCRCGKDTVKFLNNLRAGRSTSCGCTYEMGAVGRANSIAARRVRAQADEDGRICLTCNTRKPWGRFAPDRRRSNGYTSNCLDCARWRTIKASYGITQMEWEQALSAQGGVCALCLEDSQSTRRFSVDHDHSCCGPARACKKCIRGLLCNLCNQMLGMVEARARHRALFADYLSRRPFR